MAVAVEGLNELNRAFRQADRRLVKDLRAELLTAAEPVRTTAEGMATVNVTNVGRFRPQSWARMRVGAKGGRLVYMVPRQRRKTRTRNLKYGRPNLTDLLLDRAMYPALERHAGQVERRLDFMLEVIAKQWGAGG